MGCATSKADDLPAVALCRDRLAYLDEAIRYRYELAEAHLAYTHALKSVGSSLHRFFDPDLADFAPSPVLNLPPKKKGASAAAAADIPSSSAPAAPVAAPESGSNSGSHLRFHSDSVSDEDGDGGSGGSFHYLRHSGHSSPSHSHIDYSDQDEDEYDQDRYPGGGGGGFMHMSYMKRHATPSVSYQHRPRSPETGHMGESSYYYNPYPNNNNPSSSYSYYGYSNPNNGGGGGGMNGYLDMQQPPAYGQPPPYGQPPYGSAQGAASTSKSPPPPPSPPRSSPWDFLSFFETVQNVESSYPSLAPSRDSREVREEEGIPDLEDVDYRQEVVKEAQGNQKYQKVVVEEGGGGSRTGGRNHQKHRPVGHRQKANDKEALYQARARRSSSVSVEEDDDDGDDSELEFDVHMVDKKVVADGKSQEQGDVGAFKGHGGPRGVSEVVSEVQRQFEKASDSGNELSKMLEVGKVPYRKHQAVSSKVLRVISPSLSVVPSQPSVSRNAESSTSALVGVEFIDDMEIRSIRLSSTLQKCYLWEKKLYDEVKAEEKLRMNHEKRSQKLKRLNERGAEAYKLDASRTLLRSLSTKIRIAIQIVDRISVKINKLRDEELWPQINELIKGLARMWKCMLECHHNQCQAIMEARSLDAIAFPKKFSDDHLDATLQLEHELINWTLRFSNWIGAQKGYVKALNNWLLKCLLIVPEETADGIAPFSPGRMGAPPLFVICNQWFQAMERISEKEVVDSIRALAVNVLQLWEQDKLEMQKRMIVNKDLERTVKNLEREDQKIQKGIQALDKMALAPRGGSGFAITEETLYQGNTSRNRSLHASLLHIFEAMERLAANSTKAYEELLQRSEEDRVAREGERVEIS